MGGFVEGGELDIGGEAFPECGVPADPAHLIPFGAGARIEDATARNGVVLDNQLRVAEVAAQKAQADGVAVDLESGRGDDGAVFTGEQVRIDTVGIDTADGRGAVGKNRELARR